MTRRRLLVVVPLVVLLLLGLAVAGSLAVIDSQYAQRASCAGPNEERYVALSIHLDPGLIEHQSWVNFPLPPDSMDAAGGPEGMAELLCVDDSLLAFGPGIIQENELRLNIPTRWVDLRWVQGRLGRYEDLNAWQLVVVRCSGSPPPGTCRGVPSALQSVLR